MPISSVKQLSKTEGFGAFSKRVLNELMSQVNEQRMIHKAFVFYVDVDFLDKHRLEFVDGVLFVGYHHFFDSASTQQAVLLAENELDGEAFLWGAKTYLHKNKIGGLNVSLDIQPGGGNTTINVFSRLDRSKRFFACIIDSDRAHPHGSLGLTARRFRGVSPGFEAKRYFEILEHHEIENLLPLAVVRAVAGKVCDNGIIFRPEYCGLRVYPDHKAGLTVKEAKAEDRARGADYWSALEDFDEDDVVCPRFGADLLRSCVSYMEELSPKKSVEHMCDEVDAEWVRISKLVASWGVGGRALRS